jgi:uncharacterized NAD(P)/FAD-binding protein YdhS
VNPVVVDVPGSLERQINIIFGPSATSQKGRFWEITAVPELREQAAKVADCIACRLKIEPLPTALSMADAAIADPQRG